MAFSCYVGTACRISPESIVTDWAEGLVPNYSDLRCDWYDPDSSAVQYTYTLPDGMTSVAAFDRLQVRLVAQAGRKARHVRAALPSCRGPTTAW